MHLEFFWNICMNCCNVCFLWKCSWNISHDPCSDPCIDPWIGFFLPAEPSWNRNSIRMSGRLCMLGTDTVSIFVFCHIFVWSVVHRRILSRIARVNLYSWWLSSKNYWFLSDLTYLKCWKYLFEIVLLLHVSVNSWNGQSGVGIGVGSGSETEAEVLCWISTPFSEKRILLGFSWNFLNTYILPVCWFCGMYCFGSPFSSKKSASVWGSVLAMFILPGPVEEGWWFCRLESIGKLPDFLQHFLRWPLMPQPLQVTSWALHSFMCCLLKVSPQWKHFFLEPVWNN